MKVVVAYSGGLDTSVIVKWVKETYNAEVIAYCADVGQEEELTGLDRKAIATGASKCYIDDIREEFAKDFIFPMMQANAIYEGTYLLGTSIARPLIGKKLIEVARKEGADAICHGATGKGNDQVRFELTAYAMEPNIKIIAAWRDPNWKFHARTEMIEYAHKNGIPVTSTAAKPYSMDRNLLHISFEGGILEDPWNACPESVSVLTTPLSQTPDTPEEVVIEFDKGIPVKVNGEALSPAALMKKLNVLGGKHCVGKIDIVENRYVGMKSRGVYETPGGTILYAAHEYLETLCLDKMTMHKKQELAITFGELVYDGQWYTPLREALSAFVDKTQEHVTGKVKLCLYKGNVIKAGAWSDWSLYSEEIATFGEDHVYDQTDAKGFINLFGLPIKVQAQVDAKNAKK